MADLQVWDWPLFQRDVIARERLVNALDEGRQLHCASTAVQMIAPWWRQSCELVLPDNPEVCEIPSRLVRDVRSFLLEDVLETWEGEAAVAAWVDQMRAYLGMYRMTPVYEQEFDAVANLQQRLWWALYFFIESVHVWRTRPWRLPQAVAATLWAAGRGVTEYQTLQQALPGAALSVVEDEIQMGMEDFVGRIWRVCQRI